MCIDFVVLFLFLNGLSFGMWCNWIPWVLSSRKYGQTALKTQTKRVIVFQLFPEFLVFHVYEEVDILCDFGESQLELLIVFLAEVVGVEGIAFKQRVVLVVAVQLDFLEASWLGLIELLHFTIKILINDLPVVVLTHRYLFTAQFSSQNPN